MTNKEAIKLFRFYQSEIICDKEMKEALDLAIKALERDTKVDYITEHWNDVRHNFVAACEAFEDILKVYGRGIKEEVENENCN